MKLILSLLIILSTNTALAIQKELLQITNEDNNKITHLGVMLDEHGSVQKITDETRINGKLDSRFEYTLGQLLNDGIVMYRTSGRNIVTLFSDNANAHYGGDIDIQYLYSGITGKYRSMSIQILKNGDHWEIQKDGIKIKKLHLNIHKKPMFGTIGIRYISYE